MDRVSTSLRRAVLAVVLTERGRVADADLTDDGLALPGEGGCAPLLVPWGEVVLAAGDDDSTHEVLARRVARWLRLRVHVADVVAAADSPEVGGDRLLARVRPRALPVGHSTHPGPAWRRTRVLGGALDLGLSLRGVDDDGRLDPDAVGLLPYALLAPAGVDTADAFTRADRYLSDMALLAAERLQRDPSAVLRPLGDCDVPTLLASAAYREVLLDGMGMRSAAIPTRTRGWLDLGRLDPAFVPAAAALTDPDDRGFPRPVLVTADEVQLVKEGGDIVRQSLSDPAPAEPQRPASPRH